MEKLHTKRRRSGQSNNGLGDTLSNKVQRNLLFDYADNNRDTELAGWPD